MNNKQERQAISQACDHLKEVLLAKNHDYGNSFGETFTELGPISGFTRFSDKYNRLKHLLTKKEQYVKDESILDNWLDAAGYAILNYIATKDELNKTPKTKPKKELQKAVNSLPEKEPMITEITNIDDPLKQFEQDFNLANLRHTMSNVFKQVDILIHEPESLVQLRMVDNFNDPVEIKIMQTRYQKEVYDSASPLKLYFVDLKQLLTKISQIARNFLYEAKIDPNNKLRLTNVMQLLTVLKKGQAKLGRYALLTFTTDSKNNNFAHLTAITASGTDNALSQLDAALASILLTYQQKANEFSEHTLLKYDANHKTAALRGQRIFIKQLQHDPKLKSQLNNFDLAINEEMLLFILNQSGAVLKNK